MTDKIYIVTDLGSGDGGKGSVVHKISKMKKAHTVIKVGGAQGSHGVTTSQGQSFAFSQWGCGTFEGVKTHITSSMVVSPEGLLNEASLLRYEFGISDVFDLLTVDQNALCATSYHGITSRLKEMARLNNPRGTIGTGIGEAYRDARRLPDLVIRVFDLSRPDLKDLLAAIRQQTQNDLAEIIQGKFLPEDYDEVEKNIDLLNDDDFLDYIVKRFQEVSRRVKIVDADYFKKEVLDQDGIAVVESSHGVLTDHVHGFYPHTSAIRTLPCFTHAMLEGSGYSGQIVNIGVTRAYQIRHGAGPMPTNDPLMAEMLLPGSHKEENRYQGKVRVGPLDLVLLRYAIAVCGGPAAFDGLAITWFDQIQTNGIWYLCNRYNGADDQTYFTSAGEIRVRHETDAKRLKQLLRCKPEITSLKVSSSVTRDNLYSFCADVLQKKTGIPIRMVSFGPTEKDKICK